jgi:hypothetical protein
VRSEVFRGHFVEPRPDCFSSAQSYGVRCNPSIQYETPRIFIIQGFREKRMQFQNLNPAFLHFKNKIVMVLLSLLNPYHVVKQQVATIARSQALMGKSRAAYHDCA